MGRWPPSRTDLGIRERWPPEMWNLALFGMVHIISKRDFDFIEGELSRFRDDSEPEESETGSDEPIGAGIETDEDGQDGR